ncbi:MAG: ketoacyl-ACP synthase III [Chlamydiia bacterium]|nr:ketoacyl-ACP synthase III [Chlamydiia bacterium]
MKKTARILALGSYLPQKILTNEELEKMVDTTDEWIVTRTGIRERRIASAEESCSFMGAEAARKCGASLENVDLILVATMTPDTLCPSTAARIQAELGLNAPAVDIQAACSGYLYILSMAKAYVESGMARQVLVVAVEKMSAFIDFTDRGSCILFGDGATSALVGFEGPGLEIENVILGADGSLGSLIEVPAGGSTLPASEETVKSGGHFLKLSGKEVFKHAVRRMEEAAKESLSRAGLTVDTLDWLVAHQANGRILDALVRSLEMDEEKVVNTLYKYGNTSASSVGIALDELTRERPLSEGQRLLLVAFGGGLTWGAATLTWRST